MKRYYVATMTHDQYNTVLTTLRLELERNYGNDAATALKSALESIQSAVVDEH